jgi:siroheme synthase-like protein
VVPYLIELRLADRPVLVVGAGAVAARRLPPLVDAGARVTVVAPHVDPAVRALVRDARAPGVQPVTVLERAFEPADVRGAFLVLALTDDPHVNAAVLAAGRAEGALCARADAPEQSDFALPAVAAAGGVRIAVVTTPAAPSAAARLRRELGPWLEGGPARFAAEVAEARRALRDRGVPDARDRLRALADGPLLDQLRAGDEAGARATLACALADALPAAPVARAGEPAAGVDEEPAARPGPCAAAGSVP